MAVPDAARQAAESYLGRAMSDAEYDQLVRATYAEADPGSQAEAAMVAASILNRTRDSGGTITSTLMAPYQFESVTGTNGRVYTPSRGFSAGPPASSRQFIEGSMTGILPNVSHKQTDFTAASPAAYAGPGHDLAYFHQAQQNYHQVGGSLFNTAGPDGSAAPVQTALYTPPMPNLRPSDVGMFALATPNLRPTDVPWPINGGASPLATALAFNGTDAGGYQPALPPGDPGMLLSPAPGSYAADTGMLMSPGQGSYQGDPGILLSPSQPPDGQYADYWKGKTFNSPNAAGFDPSKPTAYRDPFGEWSVPDSNDASGTYSPDQLQTMFSGLPLKDNASDPRFPPGWSPGQPLPSDAGDAGSWPDNAATNFTQPNYWTPSTLNPSQLSAMDGGGGSTTPSAPSYNIPPVSSLNPSQMFAMGDYSNYKPAAPPVVAPSIWQSNFDNWLSSAPMPVDDNGKPLRQPSPLAAALTSAPKPTVSPQSAAMAFAPPPPPPMTPQKAFMQQAGPAPQNVDWARTLQPDPYAQPNTDSTWVLQDLGGGQSSGGPGFASFVYG